MLSARAHNSTSAKPCSVSLGKPIAVRAQCVGGHDFEYSHCTTWRKNCNGWSTMHGLWGEPHCGGCIVVINSVKPFTDKDYGTDARASDTAQNQRHICSYRASKPRKLRCKLLEVACSAVRPTVIKLKIKSLTTCSISRVSELICSM